LNQRSQIIEKKGGTRRGAQMRTKLCKEKVKRVVNMTERQMKEAMVADRPFHRDNAQNNI